jgi:hypothetical protein
MGDSMSATIEQLVARLHKGDDAIAAKEKAGKPVPERWLSEWFALLAEYERTIDERRQLAADEPGAAGVRVRG